MAKQAASYDLVIVESPAKATTIGKFLGNDYIVESSYGHIRDLKKASNAIDIENNFAPQYEVSEEKQAVVAKLRKLAKGANQVWPASDEDREGEAISWHLSEVLGLDSKTTKRIVFHEITKDAILNAIKNPRTIDMHLVDAQQARRVLDRLVGFELSPVLWHKVKPQLSAGRVQSVAVKIIVEREREIFAFVPTSSFQVTALLDYKGSQQLKAELSKKIATEKEASDFLKSLANKKFEVSNIAVKPTVRQPASPFTTSTLQQEASRKLGFPVSRTMSVAQQLYEAGYITYMRTDSVNLAETAIKQAYAVIADEYGKEYAHSRRFKTTSKGAQEAHEAIRPTNLAVKSINTQDQQLNSLYQLIWRRTVASQMTEAQVERTTVKIDPQGMKDATFSLQAEIVKFDGFLRLYTESSDNDTEEENDVRLPEIHEGDIFNAISIDARERFTQHPPRYNEAMLVHKMEELGIGRPSTYAPIISTIQQRGYVIRDNRDGVARNYIELTLKGNNVSKRVGKEKTGAEKSKLFPTDIGMVVNDFLCEHFKNVMDYNFTANVEKQFDEIAEGSMQWQNVIDEFYKPFHTQIDNTMSTTGKSSGERILGVDPATGKQVSVRVGRFGPLAQIGSADDEDKPRFSSLRRDQRIETITLEEALALFQLPRTIGEYEGKEVVIGVGMFGPYIRHDGKFISLKKGVDDPYTIDLDTAIVRINDKREADIKKTIKIFDEEPELKILNGRWGPYVAYGKEKIRIPKTKKAEDYFDYAVCKAFVEENVKKQPNAKSATREKTTAAKKVKTTSAKTAAKKTTKK